MTYRTTLWGICWLGSLLTATTACRREPLASREAPKPAAAVSVLRASTDATTSASGPSASSPGPSASSPSPSAALARPASMSAGRAPTPLDDAGKRAANEYLAALARGRKATLAKDFALAEAQFSRCLQLLPKDARALAERGYARLLNEQLPDAEADLAAASDSAPNATLLLQILHNRMLVAQKRGDETAARRFEQKKKELKQAHTQNGVSCHTEQTALELKPATPGSLKDAVALAIAAHAKAVGRDPSEVSLAPEAPPAGITEGELWQRVTNGPRRDGSWTFATDSFGDSRHVLISQGSRLYLYPSLTTIMFARCPSFADVRVAGGAAQPWHIRVSTSETYEDYMCEWPDGSFAPCTEDRAEAGKPMQSFCRWTSSQEDLLVLDAKTFEGLSKVSVSAEPSERQTGEPSDILEYELRPDQIELKACGKRQLLPYAP